MKKRKVILRKKGKPSQKRPQKKLTANSPGPGLPERRNKRDRTSPKRNPQRILLVDDDPEALDVFSALLNEAGYQVDKAANALAAICAVIRHTPDLVLADIRMPIIDGAELARELKRHRDSRHIPVVALTGYDTPGMRASALQSGYDDYISKPIAPAELHQHLARILSSPAKT